MNDPKVSVLKTRQQQLIGSRILRQSIGTAKEVELQVLK